MVGNKCNIAWGADELAISDFEVLVNKGGVALSWVKYNGSNWPDGAADVGEHGQPLYVGRMDYQGGTHPGQIFPRSKICNIGYGGKAISLTSNYEVLVATSAPPEGHGAPVPNFVINGTFDGNPSYAGWTIEVVDGNVANQQTGGHPGGYAWLEHDNGPTTDPSIRQEINGLSVGSLYVISGFFKPGSHPLIYHDRPGTPCLAVDVDGVEQREYIAPADVIDPELWDDTHWHSFAVPFKATRTSHTIRFRAEINNSNCNVALDNISVEQSSKPHWEYGEQEHWAELCHPFLECDGTSQSPINITGWEEDASLLNWLEVQYDPLGSDLINNGYTLEFEVPEEYIGQTSGNLRLGSDEYKLLQFHFHSHSEHSINGTYFPMEVHLVHKNERTGALAVLGVLFRAGAENKALAKLINAGLPKSAGNHGSNLERHPGELLPPGGGYFTYRGSLTTPPCSEIVTWFVFDTPVEASREQINRFAPLLHDDYRPLNDLNGRIIRHFTGGR
ncbi:MAG: DUF3421 domain-containing protein [Saprospirales bacterium]|nr:DUF3421 domain-containing protein [Saprospirales bacterium]